MAYLRTLFTCELAILLLKMAENRQRTPYSPREYAEMHYFYGVAQGNAREAASPYRQHVEKYGGSENHRFPDHRVFIREFSLCNTIKVIHFCIFSR